MTINDIPQADITPSAGEKRRKSNANKQTRKRYQWRACINCNQHHLALIKNIRNTGRMPAAGFLDSEFWI